MNVEISRNELAGALNALGKLISRTNQAEVYRSLRIKGKNSIVSFQTVGSEEAVTYAVPAEGVEEFACLVNFDNFRTVARYNKTKNITLTYEEGRFGVGHTLWVTLASPTSPSVILASVPLPLPPEPVSSSMDCVMFFPVRHIPIICCTKSLSSSMSRGAGNSDRKRGH